MQVRTRRRRLTIASARGALLIVRSTDICSRQPPRMKSLPASKISRPPPPPPPLLLQRLISRALVYYVAVTHNRDGGGGGDGVACPRYVLLLTVVRLGGASVQNFPLILSLCGRIFVKFSSVLQEILRKINVLEKSPNDHRLLWS